VLIWLDFTDNINNGYYATALQMPKPLLMQKNKLEAGTDGGYLSETTVGQLAFYVQDEWNINNNFKLSYGLRADKPLYFNTSEIFKIY
jgi:outer membrane receptor protein involved in Fe transport